MNVTACDCIGGKELACIDITSHIFCQVYCLVTRIIIMLKKSPAFLLEYCTFLFKQDKDVCTHKMLPYSVNILEI